MLKSYSRATNALAVALLLALGATSAFADKKGEQWKLADQAGKEGRFEEAAQLYCAIAAEDPKYKNGDVVMMCNVMTKEAARVKKKYEDNFSQAVSFFQSGQLEDAEQKFRNVKDGPHLDEARSYLAKINAARTEAGQVAAFQKAVAAYQAGNFGDAKVSFLLITGGKAGEAKDYLAKINQYEQAMAAGNKALEAKDYRAATERFNEAIAIRADGPGDPRGKLSQTQQLMAAAAEAEKRQQQQLASAAGGGGSHQAGGGAITTSGGGAGLSGQSGSALQPAKVVGAVKLPTRTLDVAKTLEEAEAAKSKGDMALARGKYLAVLGVEPANVTARGGLRALPRPQANEKPSAAATADADTLLARGIGEFYSGQFEDSEVHIKEYIEFGGTKTGLGFFYIGASKITRYYLGSKERRLLLEAKNAFSQARQTASFHPPDQKFISPVILKEYESGAAAN